MATLRTSTCRRATETKDEFYVKGSDNHNNNNHFFQFLIVGLEKDLLARQTSFEIWLHANN